MKNKRGKVEEPILDDLKSATEGIIEQKQLENSALKKILKFLEKDNEKLKNGLKNITSNQIIK